MTDQNTAQQSSLPQGQTTNTTQQYQQTTGTWPAGTEAQQQQWAAAWANYGYNQQLTPEQYQQYYQYYMYYGYWPQQQQYQYGQTGAGTATAASYASNYPTITQGQQLDEAKKRLEAQKRAAGLPTKTKPTPSGTTPSGSTPSGTTPIGNNAGPEPDFQSKVQQASSIAQQLSKSQRKKLKRQQMQQAQKQQQSSINWSPDVRAYVERAFSTCEGDEEKSHMELLLREVIKQAIQDGSMSTKDWLREPVPVLPGKASVLGKRKAPSIEKNFQDERADERRKRFQKETKDHKKKNPVVFSQPNRTPLIDMMTDEIDWDKMTVKGTSTALEKEYFRLTRVPDPATVRPEAVLKQSFQMVKERWKNTEDWDYVCEQMKSIRQDLTVQSIKNEFAVEVYETHARLCLENGDIIEFNQCQSNLKVLYNMGVPGSVMEFTAYRILYLLYERNNSSLVILYKDLTKEMKSNSFIKHAMQVERTFFLQDYHGFFNLYEKAPNMGQYVMETLFDDVRFIALKMMSKSFRPDVPFDYIQKELHFENEEECKKFLSDHGVVLEQKREGSTLLFSMDTKSSFTGLLNWEANRVRVS